MYKNKLFIGIAIALIYLLPSHLTSEIYAPATISIVEAQVKTPITPKYILIPNAKVNTNIIEVGITRQGNLDVPNNYTEVGWYKYGTRPGEIGSAVLDGHVDDAASIPGPFKNLHKLQEGDDIFLTLSDGAVQHYIVTLKEVYDTNKFPGEKVFHETGDRYLKIITCHGTFVPKLNTYNQRLIITAVLVS